MSLKSFSIDIQITLPANEMELTREKNNTLASFVLTHLLAEEQLGCAKNTACGKKSSDLPFIVLIAPCANSSVTLNLRVLTTGNSHSNYIAVESSTESRVTHLFTYSCASCIKPT